MEEDRLGRRIRAFRKLKGYTQEQLAKDIGISVSVLGEVERGSRKPKVDLLHKIANQFCINVEELQ
ncbi:MULTISPECIES: helix-turn-helix domain-containing protein [Fictibacillus]|jgi:transcriptional regulator with XRE-family HTH domain|uniref:helix-turn-helix domain-containing protein n=1 Tax=Fictibacillus TaxID=1329200 RepID=UPI001028DA88|nr:MULTISPECIES: helix-turn-helix transcriptional regulator [Fictibacillus]RZT13082.1 DNA-binding XRE family transcriptional regulator [Fictibacillus sp. BK138]